MSTSRARRIHLREERRLRKIKHIQRELNRWPDVKACGVWCVAEYGIGVLAAFHTMAGLYESTFQNKWRADQILTAIRKDLAMFKA